MGAEVCRTVAGADGLELVAGVDPFHAGKDLAEVTGASLAAVATMAQVVSAVNPISAGA